MTTKASKDVLDLTVRPVTDFVLNGTGTASIDGTPIGNTTPDAGTFTNLTSTNLTTTGVINFTGATVTGLAVTYADVAENYKADQLLEPGAVVALGGINEITLTTEYGDDDVFGVISTQPAMVMNQTDDPLYFPVVMVGRAPCRVKGSVTKGCRLVADAGGVAVVADSSKDGLVFARSLENKIAGPDEINLVEVAIVTVK